MDLAIHVSGRLIRDCWYLAPAERITLPLELLCHDNLDWLGLIDRIG